MNPDLLNPVQVYIGRLKSKIHSLENSISHFKKYDKNRTKYYKDLVTRVGELESELEEYYKVADPTRYFCDKVEAQRTHIRHLQSVLELRGEEFPQDMDLVRAKHEIKSLRDKVKVLTDTNRRLKDSVSELCYKLNNKLCIK